MEYQEAMTQLIRLRSLLVAGGDDSVFSNEDRQIIEAIHLEETGQKVRDCNCRDRYADAVIELYRKLKRTQTMAKDQKYMLRPGVIIWIGTDAYSRHNLTDKVAKAYLKANPEAIKKFERVPEDYITPAAAKLVNENPEA
jgi:hypothetical protein